jgi:hypothetical protein
MMLIVKVYSTNVGVIRHISHFVNYDL